MKKQQESRLKNLSGELDDNSQHKKAKGVNKTVVSTISHNEYKDVLMNKKCLKYSMNRI